MHCRSVSNLRSGKFMRIGSIVTHCYEFDRMVTFWQAALRYVPRHPAKDGWAVLIDPTGIVQIYPSRHGTNAHPIEAGCT